MKELRKIKSIYRNGNELPQEECIKYIIDSWYSLLKKDFRLDLSSLSYSEIMVNKLFSSGYERLRYLEILYMSLVEHGYYHKDHEEIVRFILKPNLYQSLRFNKLKIIERYLYEIYDIYIKLDLNFNAKPLQSIILLYDRPRKIAKD